MTKSILIALGGNALSPKEEAGTIYQQFAHTRESVDNIMHFVQLGYNICLTHGNGPQVGDELYRMELTHETIPPLPLGVCVAETQGSIGYMVQQSLQNVLKEKKIDREVVTLITQTIVDKNDPSINDPQKFIGRRYEKTKAQALASQFNWTIKEQEPGSWRQVVPSPIPEFIEHGRSIQTLVDSGTIVIASGGGGIPTFWNEENKLEGLNAVIDKDLSAALLGRVIKSEELWIIITLDDAKKYFNEGHFQEGSMGPKIKAAMYFLRHHGKKVIITSIAGVLGAINGSNGTTITK